MEWRLRARVLQRELKTLDAERDVAARNSRVDRRRVARLEHRFDTLMFGLRLAVAFAVAVFAVGVATYAASAFSPAPLVKALWGVGALTVGATSFTWAFFGRHRATRVLVGVSAGVNLLASLIQVAAAVE